MSASINKITLLGHLGKDPEVRYMQDGSKVVSFPLATSEFWKDKVTGEKKERTEWHKVVVFNDRLGEVIEKYTRKGSRLYVEGQIQTRKWTDQNNQDRYTTEVILSKFKGEVMLMDNKGSADYSAASSFNEGYPQSSKDAGFEPNQDIHFSDPREDDNVPIFDDKIPF